MTAPMPLPENPTDHINSSSSFDKTEITKIEDIHVNHSIQRTSTLHSVDPNLRTRYDECEHCKHITLYPNKWSRVR